MYDFVAIGDATLDVFVQIDEASVMCELDNVNCKLCLNYADKIAAKKVDFIIGGNAINAAVGARRLGLTSAFFSTVGDDDTGKKIQAVLEKEGVSQEYLTVEKDIQSNYSVVINYQGERTILVYHLPRNYNWNVQQTPKWFYVTSMGHGFEPVYDRVLEMVHQGNVYMSYNPGTHQLKKGLEFLKPSLASSTILFLNKEEAVMLLGIANHPTFQEILTCLKNLGPRIVVVTDGKKGSYAYDGQYMYFMALYEGPVVERTGAGDSYATAFTVAIAEGKTIPEAMQWGNANSTSVVGQVGPEAGLLTEAGIHDYIEKNKAIQPTLLMGEEQPTQELANKQ